MRGRDVDRGRQPAPGGSNEPPGQLRQSEVRATNLTSINMYTQTQINEVLQNRAAKITEQRRLNDKALAEKRDFTADEQTQYDNLGKESDSLKKQSERMLKLNEDERSTQTPQGGNSPERADPTTGGNEAEHRSDDDVEVEDSDITLRADSEEVRTLVALRKIMAGGSAQAFDPQRRAALAQLRKSARGKKEYREAYARFLRSYRMQPGLIAAEQRDMQADNDAGGGYMLAPAQMVTDLIRGLDNAVIVRQFARKFTSGYNGLGAVSLESDVDDFDWTTELAIGNETSLSLGKREMKPHPLAKIVKISKRLAATAPEIVSLINERLAYKLGITQEKAYLTGSGAQQPLGVFTASSDGVPTSRDVSSGNTTTAIGADNLLEVKYSMKAEHRRKARWLFHRDAIKMVAKLKDGQGQYLWQPGLVAGTPDRLVNLPVDESEYAPNTFTTGLYVGLLANWDYYWIVDSLDLAIQVLVELYAASNKNGYHARYEGDGQPVLGEAFARVKLA